MPNIIHLPPLITPLQHLPTEITPSPYLSSSVIATSLLQLINTSTNLITPPCSQTETALPEPTSFLERLEIVISDSQSKLTIPISSVEKTHSAKKQVFIRSCGAACLLCAAQELGIKKIPPLKNSQSELYGLDTLELNMRCEFDLYRITSGYSTQKKTYGKLSNAGISMPDGIVTAARILGLNAYVVEKRGVLPQFLKYLYPNTTEILHGMGCPINHHDQKLNEQQRCLEVLLEFSMHTKDYTLHWVLHRSDGSYMDPDTGKNYANFKSLNKDLQSDTGDHFAKYFKTGISIIVEPAPK